MNGLLLYFLYKIYILHTIEQKENCILNNIINIKF